MKKFTKALALLMALAMVFAPCGLFWRRRHGRIIQQQCI